jgi:Na+/melibiose symporter-like transporter
MMADVGDEVRLDTHVERTALLYALLSGTVKIGSALAVFVTFSLLGTLGFDPKAKTGDAGIPGLMAMFSILPAALALVASAVVAGFPLTEKRHSEIRDALAARDLANAGPEMGQEPLMVEEIHAPAQ